MLQRFLTGALDRLGPRYPLDFVAVELCTGFLVTLGAIALLSLYIDFQADELVTFLALAEGLTAISLAVALRRAARHLGPIRAWLAGSRTTADTVDAWRTAVGLPYVLVREAFPAPLLQVALPISLLAVFVLQLNAWEALTVFAGSSISIGFAFVLHYFALEIGMRPVVAAVTPQLPRDVPLHAPTVSLRWKLMAVLPLMCVVTGIVVAGLSGHNSGIEDLGFDVVVAVAVAFTISLALTLLIAQSIAAPVHELLAGTRRVGEGDLGVRVPVSSNEELAELATGFNEMVAGLAEREQLREAFGTYVAPDVAERVMEEGEHLEGEEVDVSVLFLDIKGFTSFAETKSAAEVVSFLNEFFGLVVPVVTAHGGYADKFLGDGLVAVFGAPVHRPDHADRALAAALGIKDVVTDRYGSGLGIGIGLNSGPVIAGTIGGGGRLEFTVIGDPVNTAARVEEATRDIGDSILLTEETRVRLRESGVELEPRQPRLLKGKREQTTLYTPVRAAARSGGRAATT